MDIPNYLQDRRAHQRRDAIRVIPEHVGRRAADEYAVVAARLDAAELRLTAIIARSTQAGDRPGYQWYG